MGRACEQGALLAVIDLRDVYTLLVKHVPIMQQLSSRAIFEQNAAPEVAMARAAGNMMNPSATQREQQEEAAAQGIGGRGPFFD